MTRHPALPPHDQVRDAIEELTQATGKPPSVLTLARYLGLANTTFRRNFPDLVEELNPPRPAIPQAHSATATSQLDQLTRDNAALRRTNRELATHLELAVANIQRLTLENHHLRQQLEAATKITHISAAGRRNNDPASTRR